jgi:hypothetical protein
MKRSTKIGIATKGLTCFLPCRAILVVPDLTYAVGIVRHHRKQTGLPWRKINSGRQALLVLAYLRKGETFAETMAPAGLPCLETAREPRDATDAGHADIL